MEVMSFFGLLWFFFMAFYKSGMNFFNTLIYLEILVLLVFIIGCFMLSSSSNYLICYIMVMYLTFSVSEAAVGLSLLVSSSRLLSFYKESSFSLLKL